MTSMHSKTMAGFSLIELMIVVTIIGIAAAIGYPMYTEKAIETRRSDAKEALGRLATLQEKIFTECNMYATALTTTAIGSSCTAGGGGTPVIAWADVAPFVSADGHYAITMINPTGFGPNPANLCLQTTCFMLQANPTGPGASGLQTRAGISDGNLRLDHAGRKSWAHFKFPIVLDGNNTNMFVDATGAIIKWSAK